MKILLVNPNRMKPAVAPLGLEYVAEHLAGLGHQAALLDLCFSLDPAEDIRGAVSRLDPALIGVTVRNTDDCYFTGRTSFVPALRDVVGRLRAASAAPIVLGGVGFSVAPEALLRRTGADFGVVGDGEVAMAGLVAALEDGGEPAEVPGVVALRDGRVEGRGDRSFGDLPAGRRSRRFVDNARYFAEGGQAGFETKRGCPMACIYCADPVAKGRRWRLLPPEAVVEELKALLDQGIDHLHTCDAEFNLPEGHARAVCEAIAGAGLGERLRWYAYCAPGPFDRGLADLLRRAGCAGVNFGADSAHDGQLERLGRAHRRSDLWRAADACRQAGIACMFDLLVGGPGETEGTVRESIEEVKRIGPDCAGVSVGLRIYDGTPLAAWVLAQGPLGANPALHGAVEGNDSFLDPVFYLSPTLGPDAVGLVADLAGGDPRFFTASRSDAEQNYDYNDNTVLVDAIRAGARGAYWDILRRRRARA